MYKLWNNHIKNWVIGIFVGMGRVVIDKWYIN